MNKQLLSLVSISLLLILLAITGCSSDSANDNLPTIHTTEHLPTFGEGDILFTFERNSNNELLLYRSMDVGTSWTELPVSWGSDIDIWGVPEGLYQNGIIYTIAGKMSVDDIYLFQSNDWGNTWSETFVRTGGQGISCGPILVYDDEIYALIDDNWDPVFAPDYYLIIFMKSIDGGLNWTSTTAGDIGGFHSDFWMGRIDSTILIAVYQRPEDSHGSPNFHRSNDSGVTWESFPYPGGYSFQFQIDNSGYLYHLIDHDDLSLNNEAYIIKSIDKGLSWNKIGISVPCCTNISEVLTCFFPKLKIYKNNLYMFISFFESTEEKNFLEIYKSIDAGDTWQYSRLTMEENINTSGISFLGGASETRLFYKGDESVYYIVSHDGGDTWE